MEIPKLTGREFKPFDWYGWIMALMGLAALYYWTTAINIGWWQKGFMVITVIFVFLEYAFRVAFGRVYMFVYYDTIISNMYELTASGKTYYVCAENEEELALYMQVHYENITYSIVDTHPVESFQKKEQHL